VLSTDLGGCFISAASLSILCSSIKEERRRIRETNVSASCKFHAFSRAGNVVTKAEKASLIWMMGVISLKISPECGWVHYAKRGVGRGWVELFRIKVMVEPRRCILLISSCRHRNGQLGKAGRWAAWQLISIWHWGWRRWRIVKNQSHFQRNRKVWKTMD